MSKDVNSTLDCSLYLDEAHRFNDSYLAGVEALDIRNLNIDRQRRALITGIAGQDGSYLAEFLLEKGYGVFGFDPRANTSPNIRHIKDRIVLLDADLFKPESVMKAVLDSDAWEVYNLGAYTHVGESFRIAWKRNLPFSGAEVVTRAVQLACQKTQRQIRLYQASTAEMFGNSPPLQCEDTPFTPVSPYAIEKVSGYYTTEIFRTNFHLFVCNGILFNHESPRRPLKFVTRKISHGAAEIHYNLRRYITLGNLEAIRDWGFAGDYVEPMWLMLQRDQPDDYVIATGEGHTVAQFAEQALSEIGISNWKKHVRRDPRFLRPREVNTLIGNPAKAERQLGWRRKVSFSQLVKMMVESDLAQILQSIQRI